MCGVLVCGVLVCGARVYGYEPETAESVSEVKRVYGFHMCATADPGTSFGGMGASREVTVAAIAEPTIALAIFGLAVGAGSTNLGRLVAQTLSNPGAVINPGHLLGFTALFVVMIAETGRLPVDNPSTHLELTIIHEAMIL